MLFPPVIPHPADFTDSVFDITGTDNDTVNRRTIITLQIQLNGSQHRHRTGSADNLNFAVFDRFADFIAFFKCFQQFMCTFHYRIIRQIGHIFVGKSF